ncbi:hypothetical protein ACIQGO_38050 [Streptomyces shenzhenensis]|uniref:hypothetical protein n=1 Tax=Streptomyces shenzhenensis TaxID=943815 RepID=UPI003812C2D2
MAIRRSASSGARRPPDRTKALTENQISALWRLDVSLREKAFWKMLYESAARADDVLCPNVEGLYPQDKRGRITAKGGATEWIHWYSGTAQLLPRLIPRRTRGPMFLTDRKTPAGTPTLTPLPVDGAEPGTSAVRARKPLPSAVTSRPELVAARGRGWTASLAGAR